MTLSDDRSLRGTRWRLMTPRVRPDLLGRRKSLQETSPLTQSVTAQRFERLTEAERFLNPHTMPEFLTAYEDELLDGIPDLRVAADKLADIIETHGKRPDASPRKIGICSDYDADGNCSLAVLMRFLRDCGIREEEGAVLPIIPNREADGYGVNERIVKEMKRAGVDFMMTLDNGTAAHGPISKAHAQGMEVMVVDHHTNSRKEPLPANAIILNPNRELDTHGKKDPEPPVGSRDLAAVGVTYMLILGTLRELERRGYFQQQQLPVPRPEDYLGLVALATVGDVVNLRTPLNRFLVNEGLNTIRQGKDPAITRFCERVGCDAKRLISEDIAFRLAPVINASGRLDQSIAWKFLTHGPREWKQIAHHAEVQMTMGLNDNAKRKDIEKALFDIADQQAAKLLAQDPGTHVLLVAPVVDLPQSEQWHRGVIGIVAGRLMEKYRMPVVVASYDGKEYKASARSPRGYDEKGRFIVPNIGNAFLELKRAKILEKGGGHPFAAGCSFTPQNLEVIRKLLNADFTSAALPDLDKSVFESLSQASATILHENRTPLAGILDFNNLSLQPWLMRDSELAGEAAHAWHVANQNERLLSNAELLRKLTGAATKRQGVSASAEPLKDAVLHDVKDARKNACAALQQENSPHTGEKVLGAAMRLLAKDVESMEPFGEGNPRPQFLLPDVSIADFQDSRKGTHASMQLVARLHGGKQVRFKAQLFHQSRGEIYGFLREISNKNQPVQLTGTLQMRGGVPQFYITDAGMSLDSLLSVSPSADTHSTHTAPLSVFRRMTGTDAIRTAA